jgi:hypothetical protein
MTTNGTFDYVVVASKSRNKGTAAWTNSTCGAPPSYQAAQKIGAASATRSLMRRASQAAANVRYEQYFDANQLAGLHERDGRNKLPSQRVD